MGLVITQEVISRSFKAKARVQFETNPRGICDGQTGIWTSPTPQRVLGPFLISLILQMIPTHISTT